MKSKTSPSSERVPAERTPGALFATCPTPFSETECILLGHGSGGRLSRQLLDEVILPPLQNPILCRRDDQALLPAERERLAFTTDSFVVTPLFFPGGDIGQLAVHGTINDLAMAGALPRYLSLSFILEEGLPIETLRRVLKSIQDAAHACQVQVVTGDTKVVGRGNADKLFINTAGIGLVPDGVSLSVQNVRPGDVVLLSGTIADHGMAIMAVRDELGLFGAWSSDTAPLHGLVGALLASGAQVRCLRDPTRGGLGAALTEIAAQAGVEIEIEETKLPIRDAVRGACELLGLDPIFVANEGKCIAIVAADSKERALAAWRAHPLGRDAAVIGHVTRPIPSQHPNNFGEVIVRTAFGGNRVLDLPLGDPLPRIC